MTKILLTLAIVAILACDGGPSGLTTGNLSITVAGLPSGTSAAITVTGPNGYNQPVSGTQTLTQLDPGTYTITASSVTVGTTTYAGSPPSQAVVVNSSASATVLYSSSSSTLGNLLVNINGLPSGSSGSVSVTGPDSYSQSVTSTQTLTNLTPGVYTITASDVVTPGGTPYSAAPPTQDATVTAGNTATATVTYSPPSGGSLDLRIDGMHLTQSTQTYDGAVPLVQGRNGYLRIFVVANQVNVAIPSVRVRFYRNLVLESEQTIPAPGASVPTTADQSSLSNSWNLPVAASVIGPGLSIVAEVDPGNTVLESNESNNAFPSAAPQALTVRSVPTLNVTLVPIKQTGNGQTGNVSSPSEFLTLTQKMHPLSSINIVVRDTFTTTTTDTLEDNNANGAWSTILGELDLLRTVTDQSPRYYYGVAKVGYTSGVAGVAYVSTSGSAEGVAMGWDYLPTGSLVAAHELAHNWGRNHAPCGDPGGVDAQYPHADGSTGVYGLDVATQTLKPPTHTDIMGYCDPKWIGDYTYTAVMNYLSPPAPAIAGTSAGAPTGPVQPTLLLWGRIRDGEMVLEPAFQVTTRPKLPRRAGPYALEARAADGTSLLSLSFEADQVADVPGNQRNFVFAVPVATARVDRISTLRLSGQGRQAMITKASRAQLKLGYPDSVEVTRVAGGNVRLRWNPQTTPMIMVRDAGTGDVLSLARGGDVTLATVKGQLELVLSDGIKSRVKRVGVR